METQPAPHKHQILAKTRFMFTNMRKGVLSNETINNNSCPSEYWGYWYHPVVKKVDLLVYISYRYEAVLGAVEALHKRNTIFSSFVKLENEGNDAKIVFKKVVLSFIKRLQSRMK